jgi:hypothetical protein
MALVSAMGTSSAGVLPMPVLDTPPLSLGFRGRVYSQPHLYDRDVVPIRVQISFVAARGRAEGGCLARPTERLAFSQR